MPADIAELIFKVHYSINIKTLSLQIFKINCSENGDGFMENQVYGVDLHIHTTKSDGTRTVEETVMDAKEAGLRAIAITDHNQFAVENPECFGGLEVIPGAEFSASYCTKSGKLLEVHIIGLFFDGVPEKLQSVFKKIPQQRKNYLDAVIARLNHLGIDISYQKLLEDFPETNQIGRRHIAELLVQKGYAENVTDAFDRLIGNRSPYWVDVTKYMKYMPMEKVIEKICQNNGFPILAHPYHYHCTEKEVEELVSCFHQYVGKHPAGMEVYYAKYDEEQRRKLLTIARKYHLYPSAASDRHCMDDPFEKGAEELLDAMKESMY